MEEQLAGGVNQVTRIDGTVRRPTGPWTSTVHALLDHLAATGFDGAPRAHGTDGSGREIVDYIEGEVTEDPPGHDGLVAAARLLRRYHDATATFAAPREAVWQLPARQPAEVICHGDVAPYNCVFRDGIPVAFIDFDTAHPGPRLWDVTYAAYRFVPVSGPAVAVDRLRAFADAYGLDRAGRAAFPDALVARLRALVEFMRERAAAGDAAYQRHLAEGHADGYLADIAHIATGVAHLRRALLDGRNAVG